MLVRLRHVKRVLAKGRVYYYHRPTMTRLEGEPDSLEFREQLARLEGAADLARKEAAPGTLGGLLRAYRASPEYRALAPASRAAYERVFDWLKPIDALPLHRLTAPFLLALRDKAHRKSGRWLANYTLATMSMLMNWARPRGLVEANTAHRIPKVRKPRDARVVNRPWTRAELETVMDALGPGLRAAVALGAYAGLREGDALAARWSCYDGSSVLTRQAKTGAEVWVPAHAELRRVLDAAPRSSGNIVTGARGMPLTSAGFRAIFFRAVRKLRAENRVGEGLTFHGLRHTVATALAEAGCDTRDIMAITGHRTEAVVRVYTERADTRRRARSAIERLENADGTANGKPVGDGRKTG